MSSAQPSSHDHVLGLIGDLPEARTLLNEAEFGLRYARPYLDALPPGGAVLEIGSGPGVLLALVKQAYPQLRVTGVEPIGPGFAKFLPALERLKHSYEFEIIDAGYEDLPRKADCDFIFLVNVFEHLDDWRDFLRFAHARLKSGGRCLILCPNYGFPYESHFSLPIVVNKKITQRVFHKDIEAHEREKDAPGLWQSLNFVKWSQVQRFARSEGIDIRFHAGVLGDMVDRLDNDPEFAARQKTVAGLARLARKLGLIRLAETRPFRAFQPYLHLELVR